MHGLMNKGLQGFLTETYGAETWGVIAARAGLAPDAFEALLVYDPTEMQRVLDAAVGTLGKPREVLLEDLGTHIVSHPTTEPVRRLLRFGGVDFGDFLNSIDELPGRARLALPGISLPEIVTQEVSDDAYLLSCRGGFPGIRWTLAGLLRAMADDYGALAIIEPQDEVEGEERLAVQLLDDAFFEGRHFDLLGNHAT